MSGQAPPERVFSDRTGGRIQEDGSSNNVWAPLLHRAQIRYRKPHTLRHSYASMLIEAGEPLTYVQQQLGHHSAAFTLKAYGHLLPRARVAPSIRSTTRPSATQPQPRFSLDSSSPVFSLTSAPHSSISENGYSDGTS